MCLHVFGDTEGGFICVYVADFVYSCASLYLSSVCVAVQFCVPSKCAKVGEEGASDATLSFPPWAAPAIERPGEKEGSYSGVLLLIQS